MNVLVVEPGFLPYEQEINGLSDMEKIVGGPIEAIYPFQENVAVVTNANGANNKLEFNRSILERSYGGVFGTFFVCGLGEETFASLTPEQVTTYRERFKKTEILVTMLGDTPVVLAENAKQKRYSGRPKRPPKPKKR